MISARLGISRAEEERALALLVATGQAEKTPLGYVALGEQRVLDTRRNPDGAHALRVFWSRVALDRLEAHSEGLFSHSVFGVSERDLQRIRELQKAYYQEVRTIVAQSEPVERVALLNLQLLELGAKRER